jgi:hypothetical protein
MTEYTVLLPEYHPKQAAFVYSRKKRIVVKAGRRGGKTVGVGGRAVERFLDGARVLYATPTAEQIGRFWSTVTMALADPIKDGIYAKNETEHTIELVGTEQRIKAKTAWNADTLRGDYGDELIFDEFQLMNEDAWEVVGAPMMLDTNGTAIFVYTPPSIRSAGVSKARDKRYASKLFKRAQSDISGRWGAFHFTSHDNPYLSAVALDEIAQDMTALSYRQEIMAEDIDEIPGALWTRALIEESRVAFGRVFQRIVIGVDPKSSAEADSETGIIAVGLGTDGHGYVLGDHSVNGTPEQWALKVVAAYESHEADRVVAEINQGGDMVSSVMRAISRQLPIHTVRATRGKYTRAEPVAALYEQGKIHHVGVFGGLEDQLCSWVPGDDSPDRLDALVWAITALMLDAQYSRPRVREY